MRGSFPIPLLNLSCATDINYDLSEFVTIYTVITVEASNHSFITIAPMTANNMRILISNLSCRMEIIEF
jgi:hypothetical protein